MKRKMGIITVVLSIVVFLTIAGTSEGQRRGQFGWGRGPVPSEILPVPKEGVEKKVLDVMEDMASSQFAMLNVPMDDGRLLRLLAETMDAKNVVEIGTSNGYSGLWLLLALHKTGGKLTTFEIDPEKVRLATSNFKRAGLDHLATIIEGDAHREVTKLKGPIDMVFIDADKEGYLDYLKKLLPLVRSGGLIVSHNMNQMDQAYIDALTKDPNMDTLILNAQSGGVGVTLKKR